MGKTLIPPDPAEIHDVMLRDELEKRYLAYALSTIMHRALPDAREGFINAVAKHRARVGSVPLWESPRVRRDDSCTDSRLARFTPKV